MFVTNEAGAIHLGIYSVFGDDVLDKISTCQWHFKRCAWRQLVHIKEDDRASFREAIHGICKAKTNTEYMLFAEMLDDICMRNKVIQWWNWRKVCRYHLVPALCGFGWTGTNWAEIGQSKMKRHIRIGLMNALFTDIIHAINECIEWIAFVKNTSKSIGKGPTVLAKRLKERKKIREYAQSIIDALQQGRLLPDMEKHSNPDRYFMGSAMSKHRVPNIYPVNNPTQKALPKGKGKGRGKGCSNRGKAKGTVQFVPAAELLHIGTADSEDSEYMSGPDINPDMPPSASTTDAAPVPEPVNISDTIPPQVGTEQRGRGRHGHGWGVKDPKIITNT